MIPERNLSNIASATRKSIVRFLPFEVGSIAYILAESKYSGGLFPPNYEHLPWFIGAILFYGLTTILDITSSIRCIHLCDRAEQLNIQHSFYETNPLLSDRPRVRDHFSRRALIADLIGGVSSLAYPPIGMFVSASRLVSACSNEFWINRNLKVLIAKREDPG